MKVKTRTPWTLALAGVAVLSFGLVAAACGNDDDGNGIDDGFGNGIDDGFGDGVDDGFGNGVDDGNGIDDGVDDGFGNGVDDGVDDGFGNGVDDGIDDGTDNGDLPGNGDEVTIDATAVNPGSLTVTAGGSVTVTNDDSEPHTVMVNGEEEGELEPGASMDITFDEPGSYEISTSAHEGMGAVVTVS